MATHEELFHQAEKYIDDIFNNTLGSFMIH